MASNEDYGIEDISPSNSPEPEGLSSDDESETSPRPVKRRIAHKEMRYIDEGNETERIASGSDSRPLGENHPEKEEDKHSKHDSNKGEMKIGEALSNSDFEDISEEGEENEAFSPMEDDDAEDNMENVGSPTSKNSVSADDDSDFGKDNEEIASFENKHEGGEQRELSSVSSLDLPDEKKSDDREKLSPVSTPDLLDENKANPDERETSPISSPDQIDETKADNKERDTSPVLSPDLAEAPKQDGAGDDDYIDAPVPSPFSDIGDITGPDHAIISDILKETGEGSHISPELEGFAAHLENSDNADQMTITAEGVKKSTDVPVEGGPDGDLDNTSKDEEKEPTKSSATESKKEDSPKQGGSDVGGLIYDIFGESDEEEEEFEGFGEEELYPDKTKSKSRAIISDDEDDDDEQNASEPAPEEKEASKEIGKIPSPEQQESSDDDEKPAYREEMISDFDLMMQKKKEAMRQRRRSKRDFEIINDNDDIIAAMIRKMKDAAEEDRMLNQAGRAATKKMKMLDSIVTHLNKADLQHTFIDCGILPVMKEWLSPLPDNSLPHLMIRKQFLKILSEFPALDKGALKMSGIGRAVMLLYKHPKETRQNRTTAGRIVSHWARPIFGVQTNFKDMTKEEREERDKMNVPTFKKRRLSSVDDSGGGGSSINSALQDEKRPRRPGDKGFIGRARVPRPSNKDYIVRPESNIGYSDMAVVAQKSAKKPLSRFEKQVRKFQERKGTKGSSSRAVSISINGSKLAL